MRLSANQKNILQWLAASLKFQQCHETYGAVDRLRRGGLVERDSYGRHRITEMGWFACYGLGDPWPGYPGEQKRKAA